MRRKEENILTILSEFPWWVSVSVAGIVFIGLKYVLPLFESENVVFQVMAPMATSLAPLSIIFLLPAVKSAFEALRKRQLLDQQEGIESIRSISWREFEELVAEAYRRQGYFVRENHHVGPDGGIDLTIERGGEVLLVQCKQWRNFKVGVKVVREMLGLVTAHCATGAIVVTCGKFTREAKNFASGNCVELIEGEELVEMIGEVQKNPTLSNPIDDEPSREKPCPSCDSKLVIRTAKKGSRAGSQFWGCSNFPRCKYTEDIRAQQSQ